MHVKRHRSEPCPVPEVSSELENLKSTVKCQASEIRALRRQVRSLQKALRLQRLSTKQQTSAHLKKYITAGQVRCSMKKKTRTQWSDEDIRSALTLRCISSKAYKYLRELREYPLPSISTLQRRVMSVSCEPGLMESALALLAQRVKFLNADEKSVVLCVDEMSVSSKIDYDRASDKIFGPSKNMCVFMARGLFASWKQPIYYDFDVTLNENLLRSILQALESPGYEVLAVVSDMGAGNRKLWKELSVSHTCPVIGHPLDKDRQLFFFCGRTTSCETSKESYNRSRSRLNSGGRVFH